MIRPLPPVDLDATVMILDAFSLNPRAQTRYEGLGYRRRGTIRLRKGLFYLYEKKIQA